MRAGLMVLVDAGVFQEQIKHVAIVLDKTRGREARCELFDDFFDLIVFKPWIDDF
jgi:hypothetical protein